MSDTDVVVRDNPSARRFEAVVDGQLAFLQYVTGADEFILLHTEVPASLRGRGIAQHLARTGLEAARASGLRVVVRCPFVRTYLEKHPELSPDSNAVGGD
ncbi:MAG: GNAT family N-acetyltransferase [Vicinamibacterales bacterium]